MLSSEDTSLHLRNEKLNWNFLVKGEKEEVRKTNKHNKCYIY